MRRRQAPPQRPAVFEATNGIGGLIAVAAWWRGGVLATRAERMAHGDRLAGIPRDHSMS